MAGIEARGGGVRTQVSPARRLALDVLVRIERDLAFANLVLNAALRPAQLQPNDAALTTDLVMSVCRRRNTLDWWIDQHASRPVGSLEAPIRATLRLAAYEAWQRPPEQAFVVGSQYTELARAIAHEGVARFVNAVCRKLTAAPPRLPPDRDAPGIALAHSHPQWLVERWLRQFGIDQTRAMCAANNHSPMIELRVNPLRASREQVERAITAIVDRQDEPPVRASHPLSLRVRGGRVDALPGFAEGWFVAQGLGSVLVAEALAPQPGETVVDACAAPGGKTTHLGALMENRGRLIAVELHEARLRLVRESCARTGVIITEFHAGDFRDFAGSFGSGADRILLDVPCSGTGTLRRKPDLRWRLRPEQIAELAALQVELLSAAAGIVKPGGVIVYSTCSVEFEENEGLIAEWLAGHEGFTLEAQDRTWPNVHDTDGMFWTRLRKTA